PSLQQFRRLHVEGLRDPQEQRGKSDGDPSWLWLSLRRLLQQLRNVDPQRLGECVDGAERRIVSARLDLVHILATKPRALRQCGLAELLGRPELLEGL